MMEPPHPVIRPNCLYTVAAAARALRINRASVKALVADGRLRAIRIPGYRYRRITGASILAFIEPGSGPNPPQPTRKGWTAADSVVMRHARDTLFK